MTDHPTNPTRQRRPHEAEDPEYLRISAQLDADLCSIWSSTGGRTLDNQLCFLYLRYVGRFNFCNYIGQRVDWICQCLRTVIQALRCLESSGLNNLKAHLRDGVPLDLTWIDLLGDPMANASKVFIVHIRDNSVSAELVDQTISQWISLALTALEVLEPQADVQVPTVVRRGPPTVEPDVGVSVTAAPSALIPAFPAEPVGGFASLSIQEELTTLNVNTRHLGICQRRVQFVSTMFENDPVKSWYLQKFKKVRTEGEDRDAEAIKRGDLDDLRSKYPAVFICGPSGSGKTTFAHNICCDDFPILFGLFSYSDNEDAVQKDYLPFVGFSDCLKRVGLLDLELLKKIHPSVYGAEEVDLKVLLRSFVIRKNADGIKYHLVGFLVSYFTLLIEARKDNPNTAYLELQCEIKKVDYYPMTVSKGYEKLETLLETSNLTKLPLILILDECTFGPNQLVVDDNRYLLTRNICRCLRILIVLMGTDARASNLIGSGTGSGGSGVDQPEWMIVGLNTPSYDSKLLEQKCEKLNEKFACNSQLLSIVTFVKSVAPLEIPWLIDICLNFMLDIGLVDPWAVLREMFAKCFTEFRKRKETALTIGVERLFNNAQVHYMCHFLWVEVTLPRGASAKIAVVRACLEGKEEFVNKHLARLFGYPEKEDCPYFSLSLFPDQRRYKKDQNTIYTPSSVFTSFRNNPITGMTLFGLSPTHQVFMNKDCNFFEAWMAVVFDKAAPPKQTGIQLEMLFNCAAILASRANGPKGCSLIEFLTGFVRQIGSSTAAVRLRESDALECPWEGYNGRRIPMLAPMSVCSWSSDLVRLFDELLPNQQPCLGVYRSAQGIERCDGIAYYYKTSKPVEEDLSEDVIQSKEVANALKIINFNYPIPYVRPPRGGLVSIKRRIATYENYDGVVVEGLDVAFAVECKQYRDGVSAADVIKIVNGKFEDDEVIKCDLFFIFASKFTEDVTLLQTEYVVIWLLESGDMPDIFSLRKVTNPPSPIKHVILISLATIWGAQYERYYNILESK